MTVDLTMLAWSAALCVVLAFPYTIGMTQRLGLPTMAGNRESIPEPEGWMARSKRAHLNMVENLAAFAALVLIAHIAGKADPSTALGAQLFFWGRLAHAIVYVAGLPWVRTAAYAVSVVGMAIIFLALIR
ncbi:MAG: MAPEG family protein [Alphaproteobacteria bacterium]|nr:MAPEG family protein [Alphaproteobacteria bacterium]